jgi:hypothetical protein
MQKFVLPRQVDLTSWKQKSITLITHKLVHLFKPLDEIDGLNFKI